MIPTNEQGPGQAMQFNGLIHKIKNKNNLKIK